MLERLLPPGADWLPGRSCQLEAVIAWITASALGTTIHRYPDRLSMQENFDTSKTTYNSETMAVVLRYLGMVSTNFSIYILIHF